MAKGKAGSKTGTRVVNILPPVVLFTAYGIMCWDFFVTHQWSLNLATVLLAPLAITLVFLVMLHSLISARVASHD
jgi:hypothetical protein